MAALKPLFKALISIAVLLIVMTVMWGPEGMLSKVSKATPNASSYIQIGSGEVEKTKIAPKIDKAYSDIVSVFKEGKESLQEMCLIYFPALDAEEDFDREYNIIFTESPDGTWFLLNKEGALLKKEKIENIQPCLIDGKEFYKQFLKTTTRPVGIAYLTTNALQINSNHNLYIGKKLFDLEDEDLTWDNKKIDLLFKFGTNICFIPTNDVYTATDKGINDDFLKEMLPGGKFNKFDQDGEPRIPFCSGEETFCKVFDRCEEITSLKVCTTNPCGLTCRVNTITSKCKTA